MSNKNQAVHIDCRWLASQITDYSIRGIANKVSELVRVGEITVGSYLPPVRELAIQLGVSRASISIAWGMLRKQRILSGGRSQGVWISSVSGSKPEHFQPLSMGNFSGLDILNLSWSAPDPALLPDINKLMHKGIAINKLNSYQINSITYELEQAAMLRWPYSAESFMADSGGFDGVLHILQSLILPGSSIAVAIPAPTLLLDILDHLNLTVLPVRSDYIGPVLEDLVEVIKKKPSAFIYRVNTHISIDHQIRSKRFIEMARLLKSNRMLLIERDDMSDLSEQPFHSLGEVFPEKTLYIRSYSNAYGPDLRLAVISGPQSLINKINDFRSLGCSWTSRILQALLSKMILDPKVQELICHARKIYDQRRQALADALIQKGIKVGPQDRFSLWIKVPSERYAATTLAARGISVTTSSQCGCEEEYIRVVTSQLTHEHLERVTNAIELIFDTTYSYQ